jgi:hypothetical protein
MRLFITALASLLFFNAFGQIMRLEEAKLYNNIIDYRASSGLPEIALSIIAQLVAETYKK